MEEAKARALGLPVEGDAAHQGPLIAGSNLGLSAYRRPTAPADESGLPPQPPPPSAAATTAAAPTAASFASYKRRADDVIREFFASGDYDEARRAVAEDLSPSAYAFEFARRLVVAAMAAGDAERERASRLLSALLGRELVMEQVGEAFARLLEAVADLEIDAPQARPLLARFLARAVVDEILPPSFLTDVVVTRPAPDVASEARSLLAVDPSHERLHHIWGVTGASSLAELKRSVEALVAEYYASGDAEEAVRCTREIGCRPYHHEVVLRALVVGLDASKAAAATALLVALRASGVVSVAQVERGFRRARERLPDLVLDDPRARAHLDALVQAAVESGVLPARWAAEVESLPGAGGSARQAAGEETAPPSSRVPGTVAGADTRSAKDASGAARPDTPVVPAHPQHAPAAEVASGGK